MSEGNLRVGVKDENGFVLTKDYGFTVEEENGKYLAFDLHDHPELGIMLLFGQQVFSLKFWSEEDLHRGLKMLNTGFTRELERRRRLATE